MLLGGGRNSSGILVLLGIGPDVPNGVMTVRDRWLELEWKLERSRAYFDSVKRTMIQMAGALDAKFRVNPTGSLRAVATVHPLGGCPMGRNVDEGVVDSYGRVFNYPGLYVADGSVMPGPVGVNPSLTIAALADRFADAMIADAKSET